MAESVLTNKVPYGAAFKASFAAYLRGEVEQSAKTFDSLGQHKHAGLLNLLAQYIDALDDDDQRLRALSLTSSRDEGRFHPGGGKVARCIALAGRTVEQPSSEELLSELLALGVDDLVASSVAKHAAAINAAREEVKADITPRFEREVIRVQDKEAKVRGQVAALKAENAQLRDDLGHLRLLIPEDVEAEQEQQHKVQRDADGKFAKAAA